MFYREELSIPVIANGNIREFGDVQKNLDATKADGVMSAGMLVFQMLRKS